MSPTFTAQIPVTILGRTHVFEVDASRVLSTEQSEPSVNYIEDRRVRDVQPQAHRCPVCEGAGVIWRA